MAKIIQERDNCMGCGICMDICPKYFELWNDEKPVLKGSNQKGDIFELEIEDIECCGGAELMCPAHCIHIIDT